MAFYLLPRELPDCQPPNGVYPGVFFLVNEVLICSKSYYYFSSCF